MNEQTKDLNTNEPITVVVVEDEGNAPALKRKRIQEELGGKK